MSIATGNRNLHNVKHKHLVTWLLWTLINGDTWKRHDYSMSLHLMVDIDKKVNTNPKTF